MSTITLNTNTRVGSSLQHVFNDRDHQILMDWMYAWAKGGNDLADDILTDTIKETKYSESMEVRFQGHDFTIYSSFGKFRLGSFMEKRIPDQVIEDFIEEIK